ncbi:hypothetical protein B0H66DRAFT_566676 [Apodospora peruviana]|uniref:Uncharacterized protein n=1 Tax=Apodospora peruviana TaxID=516989 RepID=A0AAE0HVF2_9PEZI|nr:hypothetical protein B0H66DRAFT_566676 [Apodospora peruviana]
MSWYRSSTISSFLYWLFGFRSSNETGLTLSLIARLIGPTMIIWKVGSDTVLEIYVDLDLDGLNGGGFSDSSGNLPWQRACHQVPCSWLRMVVMARPP